MKELDILKIMKAERCDWAEAEKKYHERRKINDFF